MLKGRKRNNLITSICITNEGISQWALLWVYIRLKLRVNAIFCHATFSDLFVSVSFQENYSSKKNHKLPRINCFGAKIKTYTHFAKFRPRDLYLANRKRLQSSKLTLKLKTHSFFLLYKRHGPNFFLLYYHFPMEDSSEYFEIRYVAKNNSTILVI